MSDERETEPWDALPDATPTERDEADLAAMNAPGDVHQPVTPIKLPADHLPPADDGTRTLHAEQLVDKIVERAGNGVGVVEHIAAMFGQLGQHAVDSDLVVLWDTALVYTRRTEVAGVEASTHSIVPAGTLIIVLDIAVRPR
jgi:hypothetical protein